MTAYVALLRAVNVGGTGKLPMSELAAMCGDAGFQAVRTYIASGNVVFSSKRRATEVRRLLDTRLEAFFGKPVGVHLRTAAEMQAVLDENPFKSAAPNRTVAIFLEATPPRDVLANVKGQSSEQLALGRREIYVFYGKKMADSKLKIPGAASGTARNMNTVAKLAAMASAMGLMSKGGGKP